MTKPINDQMTEFLDKHVRKLIQNLDEGELALSSFRDFAKRTDWGVPDYLNFAQEQFHESCTDIQVVNTLVIRVKVVDNLLKR